VPETADNIPDITCFRCGECCRRYQAPFNRLEAARLADYLDLSLEDFLTAHADPRWPGVDSFLVKHQGGGCRLLRQQGREYLCAVHEVKPQACRDWAASFSQPECRRGLKEHWGLTVGEDGEPQGAPEDTEAFKEYQAYYRRI
jgi:Fe-S-cluster containining protein